MVHVQIFVIVIVWKIVLYVLVARLKWVVVVWRAPAVIRQEWTINLNLLAICGVIDFTLTSDLLLLLWRWGWRSTECGEGVSDPGERTRAA